MRYLITGGCGFLGSNLAHAVLEQKSHSVLVLDNLSRKGSDLNLKWLRSKGEFQFIEGDTRDAKTVESAIRDFKPEVIFHLAGQVAMTTSLADPRKDFEINVGGGINVLEAVRQHVPNATVIYSSTNKVYGDMEYLEYVEGPSRYTAKGFPKGFDESVRLEFSSPYGCSKGATDQYMLDYARVFGLKTVVFRHSSIFGGRQFSTFDQGWIGWFAQQAIELKNNPNREAFTISGNGKQVRDVLFVSDIIDCYFKAAQNIDRTRGQAFNIGGGADNSLSLLELFGILEEELGVKMKFKQLPWRQSDQKVFIADITKAYERFGWKPRVDRLTGVRQMIEWVKNG